MADKGMVYIFTGDGKGKTSAALGVAVRAAVIGKRVAIVQWYKQESWDISEHSLPTALPKLTIHPQGKGFHIIKGVKRSEKVKTAPLISGGMAVDSATEDEHKQAADQAMELAQTLIGQVEVLVLDEILNAIHDALVREKAVINLLNQRGKVHVILTGRNAPEKLMDLADLVTEMKKIKHPYDKGKLAVKGLDF